MAARTKTLVDIIWPGFDRLIESDRAQIKAMANEVAISLPLMIVGLVWLGMISDARILVEHWPLTLLFCVLIFIFEWIEFTYVEEPIPGLIYGFSGTMGPIITVSAAFILGPSVLWVRIAWAVVWMARLWMTSPTLVAKLNAVRLLPALIAEITPLLLVGLVLYERWVGGYPLESLHISALLPTLGALLIGMVLTRIVWLSDTITSARMGLFRGDPIFAWMSFVTLFWPMILAPFGLFSAALYSSFGIEAYVLILTGLMLVGLLARQMSLITHRMQQRSRELAHLDDLSQALLSAPPDASTLSEILEEHVPGMFLLSIVGLRLFSLGTEIDEPPDEAFPEELWLWAQRITEPHIFPIGEDLPWGGKNGLRHVLVMPIRSLDEPLTIGAIAIARRRERGPMQDIIPAVHSLAALIASTLQGAARYRKMLSQQRAINELVVAGEIQASFLPMELPKIKGWQFTATLEPARETSGDFYDLIPMWDGRIGIVIADVADKGVGAALYMALSRTLLRTYATEFSTRYPGNYAMHPERVLNTVNQAILADTNSDLFVTCFFGILDPDLGLMHYASAGHNAPLLLSSLGKETRLRKLHRTGVPLGVFDDRTWTRDSVAIAPGDVLVLYTDGITDARNPHGQFFDEPRLESLVKRHCQSSARHLRELLISEVHGFMAGTAQFDDMTLVIVKREK